MVQPAQNEEVGPGMENRTRCRGRSAEGRLEGSTQGKNELQTRQYGETGWELGNWSSNSSCSRLLKPHGSQERSRLRRQQRFASRSGYAKQAVFPYQPLGDIPAKETAGQNRIYLKKSPRPSHSGVGGQKVFEADGRLLQGSVGDTRVYKPRLWVQRLGAVDKRLTKW